MAEQSDESTTGGGAEADVPAGGSTGLSGPGGPTASVPAASVESRARRIWVRVTLTLATILTIFAIFAIWADRQLLNPDNWSDTSTQLLQKQTIRTALSSYLVNQLYNNVDVEAQLKSGLPDELAPLAGPISGALHSVAEEAAERALASARIQNLWRNANRAAAQTLVTIVEGGGSRVEIEGGTVSLNLRQIVSELTTRLGLPSDLANKLPPSVANVKVVTSDQLGLVRNLAKALHALAIVLTILAIALYALAVFLAYGRRRRTLMNVGFGLVLAGIIVILGRKIGQGQLVSAITKDASIEPAARDTYSVATSLLVQVATASIIIGIPVILAAWLAGPARWAMSARRFLAPHCRARPALIYWITAALLALVFIWGPIPSTRNPVTMLLYTVLAFAGAYVLARQMAQEFPDAEPVSLRDAMSGLGHSLGEKMSRARAATTPAPGGGASKAAELERLAALHDRAAITDAEYAAAKRDVLSAT
ncbi:MAG TPA: SHOCT domain-containing protein [Solirubrobacteraceae bacterium]|nr:SHOCT domain-containing protein [Solirubrobacteraceae bacterium]